MKNKIVSETYKSLIQWSDNYELLYIEVYMKRIAVILTVFAKINK